MQSVYTVLFYTVYHYKHLLSTLIMAILEDNTFFDYLFVSILNFKVTKITTQYKITRLSYILQLCKDKAEYM